MAYGKNIGHNLITQALKICFGVLTGILVARALGPSGQGSVAYILLVFSILGSFGHFGITSAVSYYQKKSGFERSAIYSTNINTLAFFAIILGIGSIFIYSSGAFLSDYSWGYIAGGIALMVATIFTSHHQAWLVGDEKIIVNNNIGLIVFFLKSFAILILWLMGLLNPASFFTLSVVAMVLWFSIIQTKMGENYLPIVATRILKAEFSYGLIAWLSSLFAFLHYRVDQIMIKEILGAAPLGIYTVAVTIAELLFLLPLSINSALTGKLLNLEEDSGGRELIAQTMKLSFYLCAFLAMVGVFSSFLIPLVYGVAYQNAVSVTLILLPGVLFASIPKVVSTWFFTSGRPQIHLYITFITLALNVSLNLIFIPLWGIKGAAFASSLSYLVYGAYYTGKMLITEGFSFAQLFVFTRRDIDSILRLLKR